MNNYSYGIKSVVNQL